MSHAGFATETLPLLSSLLPLTYNIIIIIIIIVAWVTLTLCVHEAGNLHR